MPEEEKTPEAEKPEGDKPADGSKSEPLNNENGQKPAGGESGDEGGNKDTAKAPDKEGEKSPENQDKIEEPKTRERKDIPSFIINRKAKTIEKLRSKSQKEDAEPEDNEDEEDAVAPEDEALIKKVMGPIVAPLAEKLIAEEDNNEINEFLSKNPDFKPFEAKARKYIAHPSRRHLPIESIFYEVAGPSLIKLGAERQKQADEKAQKAGVGGGSDRGGSGGSDVMKMPKDAFEAKQEKVRRGQNQ